MPSGLVTPTTSSVLRRLAPWAVVLLIGVLLVGILPLAAAGFLGWIIIKSIAGFTRGENLTLLGILVSGIAMLVIAQMKKSPFFDIPRAKHGDNA